jgi:hypothetical protein
VLSDGIVSTIRYEAKAAETIDNEIIAREIKKHGTPEIACAGIIEA